MVRNVFFFPWVLLQAAACIVSSSHAAGLEALGRSVRARDVREFVADRVIVVLQSGTDPDAVAREHGLTPDFIYRKAFTGFSAKMPAGKLGVLSDRRLVRTERDQVFHLAGAVEARSWGVDRIDQRSLPLDHQYSYKNTGRGVTVYIMDTGIRYDHQEFDGRARPGYDSYEGDGSDCHGHGTHVAGTAGGTAFGVAREASLVSVRIMNCGGIGTNSAILAGIDWVVENHRGPSVANFSITGPASKTLDEAVKKLVESGVTVVSAAGNQADDACNYSPARLSESITVGATESSDRRWTQSNYGSCVNIFAPGHAITSASIQSTSSSVAMSGTSMAAPHVAGAAALYLEKHGKASPREVKEFLLAGATIDALEDVQSPSNLLLYIMERTDSWLHQ